MISRLRWMRTENTWPYRNLAIEEYLTMHTAPGEIILFLWQNRHTVVIGKNQDAWKECKVNLLEDGGGYLVRRLSGGGAVYHDAGNLNFTFCVRKEDYDVDRQLAVILRALGFLGIEAEKTGRNDITVGGRKISGNAFYRSGPYCYHHGTLLVNVDPEEMGRYLNVDKRKLASKGVDSVRARVGSLAAACPDLTIDTLAHTLVAAFAEEYGLPAEQIPDPGPDPSNHIPSDSKSQLGDAIAVPQDSDTLPGPELAVIPEPELAVIPEPELAALTEKFSSWEWRFGHNVPFTYELEDRFNWGDIALRFSVSGGIIQHLEVRSDAMDDRLGTALCQALTGKRYEVSALAEAAAGMALSGEIVGKETVRAIRRDIVDLIKEKL